MEWMESQGVTPWISMELVHMETIKEILSHGTGFSFLPLQGVREELKQGVFRVVQLANAPKWKRDTYAVTPAKRKNSDKINALIEFVIQEGLDYLAALKVIS
jgi:DNA-binding transcriptional LysR family regulator